jgi:hypothetical protein
MHPSETYVFSLLKKYSDDGKVWKFFEHFDENGEPDAQAKFYPELGYWVAYPDFECYESDKLMLLVEVKGQKGFFDGEDGKIAMKYRSYKSYQKVSLAEDVEVRICFSVIYRGKNLIFWESLDSIFGLKHFLKNREYKEWNYKTKRMETKKDTYIIWDATDFRSDEENVAK